MPKTCFAPAAVFGSKQIEDKSAFVLGKVTSFGCQVVLWHQKKVMKTMKKKNGLEKSPQKKGLEKPSNQRGLEKSSGRKGLEKPMKKPSCNDGDGLEKPGTIKDKVKATAEEAEGDADQGAAILHGSLSKLDKSKLWAKHQASLRGNKALEKAHAQLGKKEKGIAAWKSLLEKEAKQFLQASSKIFCGRSCHKDR